MCNIKEIPQNIVRNENKENSIFLDNRGMPQKPVCKMDTNCNQICQNKLNKNIQKTGKSTINENQKPSARRKSVKK